MTANNKAGVCLRLPVGDGNALALTSGDGGTNLRTY